MRTQHRSTVLPAEAGTVERVAFLAAIVTLPPALAVTAIEPGLIGAAIAGAGLVCALVALAAQHRRLRRSRAR